MEITAQGMHRPRIKPEHRAYRTIDGHIRIGSVIYGIGSEILDPQGWIWSLVQAMDGTRAPDSVVSHVISAHAAVPADDIRLAMDDLVAAGFVEDAGASPPGLSGREQSRYSRSMTLSRWMDLKPRTDPWYAQRRLRQARVLLLGVGGTGGFAAQGLVASGVGELHCVDPDDVELSNLNRQPLFREHDLGSPKIDAALSALRALNSDVTVTGERREVRELDDLTALLSPPRTASTPVTGRTCGFDVLVLAADRPQELRRWANRACLAAHIPWVDGGYQGPLITVGVHVPGQGACWECHRAGEVARRDLRLAPGQDEEVASPHLPWNPANAVTAGLSGNLLAHATLALLTGIPALTPGFRFGINLMVPGDPVMERFEQRPDCPACGSHPDGDAVARS